MRMRHHRSWLAPFLAPDRASVRSTISQPRSSPTLLTRRRCVAVAAGVVTNPLPSSLRNPHSNSSETEAKVTIISTPQGFNEEELYVDLEPTFGRSLFLKCEGFNFAGSIKLKAAAEMVEAAERDGMLRPGSVLVESSSGNLGVALSMIAANKGYGFLCVTDPVAICRPSD